MNINLGDEEIFVSKVLSMKKNELEEFSRDLFENVLLLKNSKDKRVKYFIKEVGKL